MTSTASATNSASSSARTSCSPAPPTPKKNRSGPKWRPRRATTSPASPRTRAWSPGRATTRTSGAGTTGTGRATSATAPGARATTTTSSRSSWPKWTAPGRTGPAAPTPVCANCTRTSRRTRSVHIWDVWNDERLHPLPRLEAALRGRIRLPGPAHVGHGAAHGLTTSRSSRQPRDAVAPEGRERPGQAPARPRRPPAAGARLRRLAVLHAGQPGARDPPRHRVLPLAPALLHAARSCGSSTTAGPSPRGPRSTARSGSSRSGTRCSDVFADRLVTFQPDGDGLNMVVVNDSAEAWAGVIGFWKCNAEGRIIGRALVQMEIDPRDTAVLELEPGALPKDGEFLLTGREDFPRATWFTKEDKDMDWPEAQFTADVTVRRRRRPGHRGRRERAPRPVPVRRPPRPRRGGGQGPDHARPRRAGHLHGAPARRSPPRPNSNVP